MTRDEAFARHCNVMSDPSATLGIASDGSQHQLGRFTQDGHVVITGQLSFDTCPDPICRSFRPGETPEDPA